jgi:peroxiredoxin
MQNRIRSHYFRLSLAVIALAASGAASLSAAEGAPPKVGEPAADFHLETLAGKAVELSELNKQGPVVLVVLRGYPGYQCPLCTRQAGEFIAQAKKFAEAKAHVVLIYPGPGNELKAHAKEFLGDTTLPKNFRFVIDPDYSFTNDYHLRWDAVSETAYPSTFVIDADGKITFAKISMTHGGRSSAVEVLQKLGVK